MSHRRDLVAAYQAKSLDRDNSTPSGFKVTERQHFRDCLEIEGVESLLEIGCGAGHDARFFGDSGFSVHAIDATPAMVRLTQQKGISAEVLDCCELDSHDRIYDAIYSMNCLLHVPNRDLDDILGSIVGRLRPNGLFYLGLWGGDDFEGVWEDDSYCPKRFFSFRSAEVLLRAVQGRFQLDYYRRIVGETGYTFNSIVGRNALHAS